MQLAGDLEAEDLDVEPTGAIDVADALPDVVEAGPGHERHRNGASPTLPPMKELVYHRLFLSGLDAFGRTKDAIVDGAYRSTFDEHGDRVLRLAHALKHELGIEPGDRVAVMATNSHQYLELYHACFLGA